MKVIETKTGTLATGVHYSEANALRGSRRALVIIQ